MAVLVLMLSTACQPQDDNDYRATYIRAFGASGAAALASIRDEVDRCVHAWDVPGLVYQMSVGKTQHRNWLPYGQYEGYVVDGSIREDIGQWIFAQNSLEEPQAVLLVFAYEKSETVLLFDMPLADLPIHQELRAFVDMLQSGGKGC